LSYEIGTLSVSKQDYNDKTLRGYLLGLLPEAETERLDQLSVSEEEIAQDLRIAEHDLIDAYVNGELTGQELLEFPKVYLGSSLRVERVRFAQAFQSTVKTLDEREAKTDDETEDRSQTSTIPVFIFGNWITWKWGLVASSLLIFLVASWFIVQRLRQRPQQTPVQATGINTNSEGQGTNDQNTKPNQPTGTSSAQVKTEQERLARPSATQTENRPSPSRAVALVLKPQMRSASQPAELPLPDDITTLALTLQLELSDTDYYRTILTEASNDRPIWQSGRIKRSTTNEGSVLYIRVPAASLKQQVYRIRAVGIYPNGTTETTNEYFFRVVK
jgi:hypothetical protein